MESNGFNKNKYIFTSIPTMLLIGESAENNRFKQISLFLKELHLYEILLKDLSNFQLKEDERNMALNIAYYIASNEELLEIINSKKDLPISRISKITKVKSNILEKLRDYILTYYIILSNPNYKSIQEYFRIKLREPGEVVKNSNKSNRIYKGIALKVSKKSIYIIMSTGKFIKIKKDGFAKVGQVCEGKEKNGIKHYKIHISIILCILLFIGSGIFIQYNKTQSIVVIQTTSNIKLHVNSFNKVIYAYSPTDKGKELVASINVLNDDVDDAITEVFKYAVNNKMIDQEKKTLVTINGTALQYGQLVKTNKFISENNIPIIINNAGNEHKLAPWSDENEENKIDK